MMILKFYSFLFILIKFYQMCNAEEEELEECSKIYILPMFKEESMCSSFHNRGCTDGMRNFITRCCFQHGNFRQMLSVFNFNYSTVYSSIIDNSLEICGAYYDPRNNVTLSRNKQFFVWQKVEDQIKIDQRNECFNNSLALFFTDILDFKPYPDLEIMFGWGLNKTRKLLFDLKLHAILVFLSNNTLTENEINYDLRNLKFSESNNLEVRRMTYFNMSFKDEGFQLCAINDFPEKRPERSLPSYKSLTIGASIVCGIGSALILGFVIFWSRQVCRRYRESKIEAFADEHARSTKHLLFGNYQDEWEVTPKELKVDQENVLGKGAFGTVYKGRLKKKRNDELIEIDVAVKFPHIGSSETIRQEMLQEICFMKALGSHSHLLVMVGYVKSIDNPLICTVFCANGDLLTVLRKHELHFMTKEKCQDVEICLLLPDLLRIAIEICNGLCYLASLNYVHRDIAARNILLTNTLQAKLSDFGLCCQVDKVTGCVYQKEGKFPIKFMAYESLKFGQFSEKSDVWSFGVLIWEMLSGGGKFFEEIEAKLYVEHLDSDPKPCFSNETPQKLVQILNNYCFQKEPQLRLSFVELENELKKLYSIVCSVIME